MLYFLKVDWKTMRSTIGHDIEFVGDSGELVQNFEQRNNGIRSSS